MDSTLSSLHVSVVQANGTASRSEKRNSAVTGMSSQISFFFNYRVNLNYTRRSPEVKKKKDDEEIVKYRHNLSQKSVI